jgi:hypothetical protein
VPHDPDDLASVWRAINANEKRIDTMDSSGTRGVASMSVQITEVIKDVAALQQQVTKFESDHEEQHRREASARIVSRRWAVATAIAFLAAIEGPLLYLVHVHLSLLGRQDAQHRCLGQAGDARYLVNA